MTVLHAFCRNHPRRTRQERRAESERTLTVNRVYANSKRSALDGRE
jgi:hypothetical protein